MNTPDLSKLDLKPLHLPEPIGWWPLAPGWWMVLAALLVAALLWMMWLRRDRSSAAPAPRQLALMQWQQICEQYAQQDAAEQNAQWLVVQANQLLKRVALAYEGDRVARLSGTAWYRYLEQRANGAFATKPLEVLVSGPYRAVDAPLDDNFIPAVTQWLAQAQLNSAHISHANIGGKDV
ncbi:DUF4381 domain-containing protein [Neptunomonas sp. XY-337]|uniref:DUF4381 domain-containing protein n=1 Tax=Neptunomonas sp. XY-337 TaxID=2561897 RepID=UPI00145B239A|nr:DUF4381 domain-containing protein [Neptunomonas sp. XY-337]